MTHLELENLITEYLDGHLDSVRQAEFEGHVKSCAGCRELVADVKAALDLCHSAPDVEPAPWLTSKILLATVGERKPNLFGRVLDFLRPALQPRVGYAMAMTVFSLSIIINAAGINIGKLSLSDLNPRTWAFQANRTGHLLYARAEKFYYDLRLVYEIESRFRQLRAQPHEQQKEAPRPEAPRGGTSIIRPFGGAQLAWIAATLGSGADSTAAARNPRK